MTDMASEKYIFGLFQCRGLVKYMSQNLHTTDNTYTFKRILGSLGSLNLPLYNSYNTKKLYFVLWRLSNVGEAQKLAVRNANLGDVFHAFVPFN
jgi:hypothetical protein